MNVTFCLKARDAVINGKEIEYLELSWQEELTKKELASRFQTWLHDQTFVERNLPDLREASYCQLLINPS
jgi:hypothetical protein